MVEVLLSSLRIPTGCLQVTVGGRADPDFGPGRRNRQCLDPSDDLLVSNGRSIDIEVNKVLASRFASETWKIIMFLDVDQTWQANGIVERAGDRGGKSLYLSTNRFQHIARRLGCSFFL